MKKLFLLIIFLAFNVFASEIENECQDIIKNYQHLQNEQRLKLALDYRSKFFSKEKYKEAYCLIKNNADSGDLESQAALAPFYEYGEFVRQDIKKAFEITKETAQKGSLIGLNNLGSYYLDGRYVSQNLEKAVMYYNQSVEKGSSAGKVSLSYAYLLGLGVTKDIDKAIKLALEATQDPNKFGYEIAMTNLGFYYGTIGNKKEELYWTEKAAELDEPSAQVNLGSIYATDITFLNKEKALYWLNKAIDRGNPQAYFTLGNFYDKGTPAFEKDDKKAMEFYSKAANLGNDKAQYQLGSKLFHNHREKEALEWFLKAANEHNNPNSIVSLYQIYSRGTQDIPQDLEKANYWLEKAKENGFIPE